MWHEHPEGSDEGVWKNLRQLATAAFGLTLAGASARPTQDQEPSLTRTSDQGQFQLQVFSDVLPIPVRRGHSWTIRIFDTGGHPVDGAALHLTGGMPKRHRGLPAQSRVRPTGDPGVYKINGVRFAMPGWWVLNLAVRTPDGRADTLTFNVTL